MNEKIKNILHTAWNEPRHFFFWLAMLSICGFAVGCVGIGLAGPALLLAFACWPAFCVSW